MLMEHSNLNLVAPFVLKTYHMVNDPSTDPLISWGRDNNSFVVIDPLSFSQHILPAYFKHNNFSSFIRQLNTYGFRKVDPDKWEFANESFLRGQKQLLKNIIRKKQSRNQYMFGLKQEEEGGGEEEMIVMELSALKQEQKAMDDELEGMNKRLQVTERRPRQMLSFLLEVVEDPDVLTRMVLKMEEKQLGEKITRYPLPSTTTPSSSTTTTTTTSSSSSISSLNSTGNICPQLMLQDSRPYWGETQIELGEFMNLVIQFRSLVIQVMLLMQSLISVVTK
ncbi:hypothetical protein Scep_024361 [Stephania cephalantha]|uniref:HSF-type DNA-binding domain-containing protein n=1 Tax=Stephania cephalantha TaxID=152367 RepID=A0AAP0EXL1_9MAGN